MFLLVEKTHLMWCLSRLLARKQIWITNFYDLLDHNPVSIELSLNVVKTNQSTNAIAVSAQQIMMKTATTCSPTFCKLNVTQTSSNEH